MTRKAHKWTLGRAHTAGPYRSLVGQEICVRFDVGGHSRPLAQYQGRIVTSDEIPGPGERWRTKVLTDWGTGCTVRLLHRLED